jgi:hypothetical protein
MSEFTRIFSPRTEKAVKAISLLTNGTRYAPTEKEVAHTLDVLKIAVNDIAQLYGVLPGGDVVVKDVPIEPAPKEEKKDTRGSWHHHDIDKNVRSIPDNQLTAYATQIMARVCERLETT